MLFKRKTYILNENCLFPQPINLILRNYIENNFLWNNLRIQRFFGLFQGFLEIKESEENENVIVWKYEGPRQIYFSHPPTKEEEQLQKEQEEFIRQNSFQYIKRNYIRKKFKPYDV